MAYIEQELQEHETVLIGTNVVLSGAQMTELGSARLFGKAGGLSVRHCNNRIDVFCHPVNVFIFQKPCSVGIRINSRV